MKKTFFVKAMVVFMCFVFVAPLMAAQDAGEKVTPPEFPQGGLYSSSYRDSNSKVIGAKSVAGRLLRRRAVYETFYYKDSSGKRNVLVEIYRVVPREEVVDEFNKKAGILFRRYSSLYREAKEQAVREKISTEYKEKRYALFEEYKRKVTTTRKITGKIIYIDEDGSGAFETIYQYRESDKKWTKKSVLSFEQMLNPEKL